jgi:hypothetical protein
VPLSEKEQRILDEIEKNLSKEDPSFARDVRRHAPRMGELRRAKLGVATFAIGFAVLLGFFIWRLLVLGVIAFGAMVGGIVLVAASVRGLVPARPHGPGPRQRIARSFGQWEQRLRERYKRP